jgi:adenine-specific DNA-methyltransferase
MDKSNVTNQKFTRLKTLLMELFQLDQPELDFGLYRIMHARADEVTKFLEKELLPQVTAVFEQYKSSDTATIQAELNEAINRAKELGADPDNLPKVKELKAKIDTGSVDVSRLESEVYDHLYTFFRRYYHEGDFLSRRVYKDGVYAIPYSGEEVKLHWANADQYYIKTDEYLKNYSIRLNPTDEKNPLRVHFRIRNASEGEHGNIKAQENADRRFVLCKEEFVAEEDGETGSELVIYFEYRQAELNDWGETQRAGKRNPPTQKDLVSLAVSRIAGCDLRPVQRWLKPLMAKAPTDKDRDRTVLEKHLDRYTKRNTFDYFIHKDLGGFLRREIDFYIKNEVMHLDDVENETVPKVEQYISKIKAIRKVAGKIIDFLAQLEDFQKKLWLKKKFVVETNYCITLDRIPEEFYPEIAANEKQRKEWVGLFQIDEIKGDMLAPGYSEPLTSDFLKNNRKLPIDTRHLPKHIKDSIISALSNYDDASQGIVIHAENFNALLIIQRRLQNKIKFAYIDPPFNLGETGDYLYRVDYKDSTWMALLYDRVRICRDILSKDGSHIIRCNHDGNMYVRMICDEIFSNSNFRNEIILRRAEFQKGDLNKQFAGVRSITVNYDNLYWYSISPETRFERFMRPVDEKKGESHWHSFWKAEDRPNMRYEILGIDLRNHYGQWMWEHKRAGRAVLNYENYIKESAKTKESLDEYWSRNANDYFEKHKVALEFVQRTGNGYSSIKYWIPPRSHVMADNNWLDIKGYSNQWEFKTENSEQLIKRMLTSLTQENDYVLDYFGGSGSTAATSAKMGRKWITVEMGNHFDTTLLRRLKQVIFGESSGISKELSWQGGGIFKYIRLESYEDALNNLESKRPSQAQLTLNSQQAQGESGFKEQYILKYMLDVETKGSQSLLNIQNFKDPTAYKMHIKRPGTDESKLVNVDLIETFNWLLGLTVDHYAASQTFSTTFKRDEEKRLILSSPLKHLEGGNWWFRTVTGKDPEGRSVLIIWRKRPGGDEPEGIEQDNLVLNEWFRKLGFSTKDREFDLIYVNGSNNLENVRTADEKWKVRLIEEDFMHLMFDVEEV